MPWIKLSDRYVNLDQATRATRETRETISRGPHPYIELHFMDGSTVAVSKPADVEKLASALTVVVGLGADGFESDGLAQRGFGSAALSGLQQ